MLRVADAYAQLVPELFSIEMWGGATFDTSMRFLKEDPWDRLAQLREKIPNILFQMLLRGSNAVGYTSYPDNVVKAFVKESAAAGIDLFRVFDSLNWVPEHGRRPRGRPRGGRRCARPPSATPATSSIPKRTKYDLKYYVEHGQGPGEARGQPDRHQGHGRACASPTPPRSWSRRCATRSASRSTSTPTTSAAPRPPAS